MSLFKSLVSGVKKVISSPVVRAVAPALGPIGVGISALGTARAAYESMKAPPAFPGVGGMNGISSASMFPALPGVGSLLPAVGRVAAGAARIGVVGAKRIYSSAASYCRKHPGWCQTIGGVAAVEAMIQRGELPAMKSRRGRGITATELKHFKRVARFTSKYCAPVRKAMSSRALRGKSCR